MPKKEDKINTFKFKNFEELIQVDILLKRNAKLDPKEESHLSECFKKWTTLNCSLEFIELRNKLGPKILTLNLLLINESEVVDILFDYINKCTSFSACTVLDLLQSLVCDIRKDFLPYLERSFVLITVLIERSLTDHEMLISAFNCIAHILTFLERHFISNTHTLFPLIKPLLFHKQKHYIRHFAAQSLAFLVKRARDFKTLFADDILSNLVDEHTPNHSDAIGKLMSSCLKIKDSLYTSAPTLFIAFYEVLLTRTDDVEFLVQCFDVMFRDLLRNLDIAGHRTMWCSIVEQISHTVDGVANELSLLVMELFFKYANGKTLVQCSRDVLQMVSTLITNNPTERIVEIVKLLVGKLPGSLGGLLDLVQALIKSPALEMEKKFAFVEEYVSNTALEMVTRNSLNSYLSETLNPDWLCAGDNLHLVISCMARLVLAKYPISKQNSWKEYLPCNGVNFNLFLLDNGNTSLAEALLTVLLNKTTSSVETDDNNKELFWLTCLVIPHMHQTNSDRRFMEALQDKLDILLVGEYTPASLLQIDTIFECLAQLDSIMKVGIKLNLDTDRFIGLLDTYQSSSHLEPVLLEILHKSISVVDSNPQRFSHKIETFLQKLKSPNHKSRTNAIAVLQTVLGGDDASTVQVLNLCDSIECLLELHETELAAKERTITRMMDGMFYRIGMSPIARLIVVNYLLGLLHVQVASLWKCVGKTLSTYCVSHNDRDKMTHEEHLANENAVWPTIKNQLDSCHKYIDTTVIATQTDEEYQFCCDLQKQYNTDKFHKARPANWLFYRLNIVKIMTTMPDLAAKKTATLSPMLIDVYTNEFLNNKAPHKPREDTLVALMQMFSKFPNIVGTHSEKQLKNLYYQCLAHRTLALQQAAFQALLNYKLPELMHYKDQMSAVFSTSNIDGLKQLPLSSVLPSHRQVMVPILLRVVVGQMKDVNKHHKQKPLIGYLSEMDESEVTLFLAILIEGLKRVKGDKTEISKPDEDIVAISGAVRRTVETDNLPTFVMQSIFKTLLGVCGNLKSVLESLLNKVTYENLCSILRVVLDFYACCTHVKDLDTDHPISQLKPLRQECANIVLLYFKKIEEFSWTQDLLDNVTRVVVQPQLGTLVEENQSSVNTTIQLSLLWSQKEELVTLITPDMLDSYVALLLKPKLCRETVGYVLVSVVYNIMQHAATGRRLSDQLQPLIVKNLPAIIEYLGGRVKNLKMKKLRGESNDKTEMNEATITRKELLMISIAVEYILKSGGAVVVEQNIFDMINSIIVFLYRTNPMNLTTVTGTDGTQDSKDESKEQLEVDFIRALGAMTGIVPVSKILAYFERILGLFLRLRKRASRTVLSTFVGSLWPKLSSLVAIPAEFGNLGEIAVKLNSWHKTQMLEMDSDLISVTIDQARQVLRNIPISDCVEEMTDEHGTTKFYPRLWLYNLTSQNCLFVLSEVSEIGLRQTALDFLEHLVASISQCCQFKCVETLFYENLWPAIRHGLLIKNESFRYSFIALVKSVVNNFSTSERFQDIATLAAPTESDHMNFFDNMLSLTTAFNSKGLRQLVSFLRKTTVSAVNLKDILLPLVLHRVELISEHYDSHHRSALTHAQRESLGSSFEALAAVANQLPVQSYQNLVMEYMAKLDKGQNVELVIKTLIGLLNGYNSAIDDANHSFMVGILHRLEKHLSKRLASDNRHKKAQKSVPIDVMDKKNAEWTLHGMALQVPVALAIINIAVKLPKKQLKEIITKVILRICDFLKAKEPEIRKEAGATLLKIIEILNTKESASEGNVRYLSFITQTVKSHLDRGFQRHVALYTCHRVLQGLHDKGVFERLSMDHSTMKNLSELYLDELFGEMAKEKSERNTAEKGIVPEAKNVKAFEGFRLLGNVIDKSLLLDFFKLIVNASKDIRTQSNLQKMQQIFEGLQGKGGMIANTRLGPISLFTLSMVLISDNMGTLFSAERDSKLAIATKKKSYMDDMHLYIPAERLDGYHVPLTPTNIRSSSHLIINCGLNLLHGLCKKYQSSTEIDLCAMLEPVMENVMKILNTVQHKMILFSAIKCLKDIIQANPPSLTVKVDELCTLLFKIHNKNSLSNDAQDTLGESLTTVFNKTIAQFLQRSDIQLNVNQYQVLLLGVQVDSLNTKRQMTSFQLLCALIENRIKEPMGNENVIKLTDELGVQIADVIGKVKSIAILSTNEKTRSDARQTIATYLRHFRQTKQYLQETIMFLLKQLAIDEDGALSACLIIQNIFKEYSSEDIDAKSVSAYVIAFVVMAMQEGVTEKVEQVFSVLVNQVMYSVDVDKQISLCHMVYGYIQKYDLDSRKFRISFHLISEMLKILQRDSRASLSQKLVDCLVEKLPILVKYADKLNKQLAASQGQDADLMNYLEKVIVSIPKKRRLDVEEESDDNEEQKDGLMDTNEELPGRIKNIMENINGILLFISGLLTVNHEDETDVAIVLHLIKALSEANIWEIIIHKLMYTKHSIVRLNATKNIIQRMLGLAVIYENDIVSFVTSQEMLNKIIAALFSQWKNEQIPMEESNTVLVNLLMVWQIVLAKFPAEVKIDMCKRIMDSANFIAKQELLDNTSLRRRCAVLKLVVGICAKTTEEDLKAMKLDKSIVFMFLREERHAQDENSSNINKKKSNKRNHKSIDRYCSQNEITEWKELVVSVGEVVRKKLGEDNFKRLTLFINKDRAANKLKRINEESALAVSNQGESLAKKQRRNKK